MTTLNRTLELPLLTLYGAGIYVLIGKVAAQAGLYAPLAFILAAVVAFFGGLSFAALSSRFPQSAGEAAYVQAAFNWRWLSVGVGLLVILTGVVSAATMAKGFVGYLTQFIESPTVVIITTFVVLLTGLAIWGVTQAVWATVTLTLIEVGGILWVILANSHELPAFVADWPQTLPSIGDFSVLSGLFMATFLAFYAFIGFEDMVNMAEETKNPQQTLPKAIL